MKTLFKIIILLLLTSCGESKFRDLTYIEEGLANYWVLETKDSTTKEDILKEVKNLSHSKRTTYIFVYEPNQHIGDYFNDVYNTTVLKQKLLNTEPKYSFLKIPNHDLEENVIEYFKTAK